MPLSVPPIQEQPQPFTAHEVWPELTEICASYDYMHADNLCRQESPDRLKADVQTEEERTKASAANVPGSLAELKAMVRVFD